MKTSNLFFGSVVVIVLLIVIYSFSGEQANQAYEEEIKEYREDKNKLFVDGEGSPLDRKQKKDFTTLNYYPINPAYRIIADFEKFPIEQGVEINTNKGVPRIFKKHGLARFKLNNSMHELLILKSTDRLTSKVLFVPFADETSGRETYGAGRYLDAEMSGNNKIILDFNTAYNPYCAYNTTYECPLPPKENVLTVKIEAGEKTFKTEELD
ncbi:DUF1684 domain-containing protein [Chondrinema litorale]|uniref:DUF1684 domain-containing protein n=1 Tax=Chondrinema litorale TaxID=2994555 RepID=UPI0025435F48|nr:DUF1684 domain-containing protein [Chondrinema litorale]UZR93056.1 DUF1684 domain-containing protein [Chondrinema litorale]